MKRLTILFIISVVLTAWMTSCQAALTPTPAPATKGAPTTAPPATKPATAVPTAAASAASTNPTPKPGKPFEENLVIAVSSMTGENALPNLGSSVDLSLWSGVYDYLVHREQKTWQPTEPGIAERWDTSSDLTRYTFYLKRGIQFQGGWGELTAEDVKFTFELAMKDGSVNSNAQQFRAGIKSIVVDDPYKVTINLKEGDWQFIENLTDSPPAVPIVSKKYVQSVGEKEANSKPVGSGPYKLIDRRAGDYLKFEAVAGSARPVPDFKWVTVKSVPEASTRIAMLKSGEADIVPIPIDRVAEIKSAGFRTISNPGANAYSVVLGSLTLPSHKEFDPKLPWWADPADAKAWERALKVRKALNLAVNRQEINEKLFQGTASLLGVAPYGIPGQAGGYEEPNPWKPHPYDPQQAKRLLAEAGYPNGFEVTVILLKHGGRPEAPQLGEAVALYWENIGLKVKRQPEDFSSLRPRMYARKVKEAWVIGNRYYAEPIVAAFRLSTTQNQFMVGAEHKTLDDLARRGYEEIDAKKRQDLARQFAQFAYDNYISVPLVVSSSNWAISKRVGEWPVILGSALDVQQLEYVKLKR